MAIQYTVPIKTYDNVNWRANIYSDSYSGLITTLKGSEGQSMSLSYEGETDDHFGVFFKSTLTLSVLFENNIDINQLQNAADRTYRIEIQRENVLYWVGYMISEGIQQPMKSEAYVLSLEAICGLSMLESMDYVHNNLPGVTSTPNRCPMNYIRQILLAQANLNVPIPIRWTNNLRNAVFEGQDVFVGDVRWSPRGEGFTNFNGEVKKNAYILEGILKSMQCRIYQNSGRWTIRRVNDYFSGAFNFKQIPGTLGIINYTSATESIYKRIGNGGYPFINEDALLTNIPGIKSTKITYKAERRDNIIPNGDLDLVSTGAFLYWGFFNSDGSAYYLTDQSLDGREGSSAKLHNTGADNAYFTTISEGATIRTGGLPIDAKDLVKLINFSFTFSPTQYGFPVSNTINGIIVNAAINNPLCYYPNGTYNNIQIINVTGSGVNGVIDIVVNSNAVISMVFRSGGSGYNVGDKFRIQNYSIVPSIFEATITETKTSPGTIDFTSNPLQLQIVMNIGENQWFLDDFGIWKDDVTTVLSPNVEGLKVGDVARVALDKFRGVILPEPEFKPKAGDVCDIKILFIVKTGQVYLVDNISVTIENSDDVYVNTHTNTGETKEESDELNISSSFGGYMVSNFMSNWDRSDSESEFVDGDKYRGTLTGLTADARMRCKYTSSKIFNGTINVRGQNWSFDEIYIIESLAERRFMPLNATYNIEKCEVNLVAIETRNDDISRTERTFGSNDRQLSN